MKIGDRQPTATGSFGSGIGGVGVGINPLVKTQFTYIDVGVNVELLARVHDNGDVSMHIDLDISSVTGHVNLGGLDQPIIGQRKVSHDIRMHEGSVQLLGGLTKYQESKSVTGIPGLSSIPILRRLFSGESVDRQRQELMIALIPHIVRRPEYTAENLRGIAVGNQQSVHLSYGRRASEAASPAPGAPGATPRQEPPASAVLPATANPAVPPVTALPATGLPATAPPATAPPMNLPPATAPPMPAVPVNPPPAATPSAADPQKPAGNAVVRFLPPQIETAVQGSITVALIIENATDAAAAPIQIQYDPKIVRLNDVGRGDFFTSDNQTPVFTKNIQNDNGMASVNLNRLPGTPGASGSGVLVTLIFQGVAQGSTTVTVPNFTVRGTQGQVVAAGSPQIVINVK